MEKFTPRLFPFTELKGLIESLGGVLTKAQEVVKKSKDGKIELVDVIKEAGAELLEFKIKIIQAGIEEKINFDDLKLDWVEVDKMYEAAVEKNVGFFDSYLRGNSELVLKIMSPKSET